MSTTTYAHCQACGLIFAVGELDQNTYAAHRAECLDGGSVMSNGAGASR